MENKSVIIIRVDASINMGSGHVIRCITLAEGLQAKGAKVTFICRDMAGNLISLIQQNGFKVHVLPDFIDGLQSIKNESWIDNYKEKWCQDAQQTVSILSQYNPIDWLIVDHYALDYKWEQCVGNYSKKIMVIDDLLDRKHYCHTLLDQNIELEDHNYDNSFVTNGKILSGGKYIILRKIFTEEKLSKRQRDGSIKHVMLFFGGGDVDNETAKALQAVTNIRLKNMVVDVVVGASNPHKQQIEEISTQIGVNFHCQIDYIHRLMGQADLFVGSCGTTTWERFCLGLPGIVASVADNQAAAAEILAKHNLLVNLGCAKQIKVTDYEFAITSLMLNPQFVLDMSIRSKQFIDGLGTIRIIDEMLDD